MNRKKIIFPLLLVTLLFILLFVSLPSGCLYGSYTDWLSQHVQLGETIRSACLEQKSLVPSFLPLGGGSNGFQFSYYGYLRPDILIGCLFPGIPMVYIIMAYALAGYLFSVLLCYYWLNEHIKNYFLSFMGSVLFLAAACFFHTHRQIMFVNYMPFLILSLLCIRKKWFRALPFCLVLIYLSSFYYSIACLAVIGWYWMRQEGNLFWKHGLLSFIKSSFLSIGMSAILLLPTASVILEHRRAGTAQNLTSILANGLRPDSLLYSPYGIGLTAIALYLLILGLSLKNYRTDCILLLSVSFCGLASWLLNGTLYARAKILIPLAPLIILVCTQLLAELKVRAIQWKLWPCLFLIPVLAYAWTKGNFYWVAADAGVLLLVILIQRRRSFDSAGKCGYYLSHILLCLVPCLLFYHTSKRENFVKTEDVFSAKSTVSISDSPKVTSLYRYDSLVDVLNTENLSPKGELQKSGMYSSVYNQKYSEFYYDTLMSPVQINNRLAILPASNPFLLNALGIRFVQTGSDSVPGGYHVIGTAESSCFDRIPTGQKQVLAENSHVLPLAYVTGSVMGESQFERLDSYGKLDAITRYTVVPSAEKSRFRSEMKNFTPDFEHTVLPDSVHLTRSADGLLLNVKKDSRFVLTLSAPVTDNVLLLEFQIVNQEKGAVVIDINHVRNKLSAKTAAYPNGNSVFHYQFSKEKLKTLQVELSEGNYLIKNVKWHTYGKDLLNSKEYSPVEPRFRETQDILSCRTFSAEQNYFVTSIPYQKGLELYVDGKSVPVVKVNQAFAGAELSPGTHDINVRFFPPGKKAGLLLSFICWMLYLTGFLLDTMPAHSCQPVYQLSKVPKGTDPYA